MIAVLSPSKDLDFSTSHLSIPSTQPRLLPQSLELVDVMKKKSPMQLKKLMGISDKLATENSARYLQFQVNNQEPLARPAIFSFSGDVYRGLQANTLDHHALDYCNRHVRILSGLYGLLRPFDRMQAYRLEMGTVIKIGKAKNLYAFWHPHLSKLLKEDLDLIHAKCLINLASQEYFEAIDPEIIGVPIINIHFREKKNEKWTFLSFNAKKARGLMVRFMADNACTKPQQLQSFDLENYVFNAELSTALDWFFTR